MKERKARTIITILAISLGVSILVGVNMGNDMILASMEHALDRDLGHTDIILTASERTSYSSVKSVLQPGDFPLMVEWVPRFNVMHSMIAVNGTQGSGIMNDLWSFVVGIDVSRAEEENFGRVNVTEMLPVFSPQYSLEDVPFTVLLNATTEIPHPVVVSERFLEMYGLTGNISAGDAIYIYNLQYVYEFPNSTAGDPFTWPCFTITAIIEDYGKMGFPSLYNSYLYLDLDDAWNVVFNDGAYQGKIDQVFVHARDQSRVPELKNVLLESLIADTHVSWVGRVPKIEFMESIAPGSNLVRGFFSIFAALSIVLCGVLIKNVLETAKQTDVHEIGVLKGIGYDQQYISRIYLSQVLFMACIGIGVGFCIGFGIAIIFASVVQSSTLLTDFLGVPFTISIQLSISPFTVILGISLGFAIPLLFAAVPILQTARIPVINIIRVNLQGPRREKETSWKNNLVILIAGTFLLLVGIYSLYSNLEVLFRLSSYTLENVSILVIYLFAGMICFLLGLIFLGILALPALSRIFTTLMLLPASNALKKICHRNIMRNKRRAINTFMMMAVGLSFLVTITTLTSSIAAGAYPGKKTQIGGDIAWGNPTWNYRANSMAVPASVVPGINALPLVTSACIYRISPDLSKYVEGLSFLGNKVDEFGFYNDLVYGAGPYSESFTIGIIDPVSYYEVNEDTFLRLHEPAGVPYAGIFQQLDDERSIILQSDLESILDKHVGDFVHIKMEGIAADVKIIAFADILPGFPWTLDIVDMFGDFYSVTDGKQYCGIISWATYTSMIDTFFKDIDLIIKNKYWQSGINYSDDASHAYWGVMGFPMNRSSLFDVLEDYTQNLTIVNGTSLINNFFPFPIQFKNYHAFDWHAVDAAQMNPELYESRWNDLNASIISLEDTGSHEYGHPNIVSVDPRIPAGSNTSAEKILAWFDVNTAENACIVNDIYAHKPSNPLGSDEGDVAYVYRFRPGDQVQISMDGQHVFNYTVAATVESALNFKYTTTGNYTSPVLFNPKTLNFDAYHASVDAYQDEIQDLAGMLYMDPDAIFISRNKYLAMLSTAFDVLQNLSFWEMITGLNFTSLDIFNETLRYENNTRDFSNLVYLKLNDTADAEVVMQDLQERFSTIPEMENYTVIDPRHTFFDITRFDQGNLWIGAPRDRLIDAIDALKAHFTSIGRHYDDAQIMYFGKSGMDFYIIEIIGMFTTFFNMIMVFALIVSLLGLSISMLISIYQRQREIGVLRSIGFSKKMILLLVYGENITLGLIGIILGLVAGLITSGILINRIPFTVLLPIMYSPPIVQYAVVIAQLLGTFLIAAILPAIKSTKIDIARMLRSKE